MLGLPLSFMAPIVLAGLVALPALWWLLRVTPPRPQRIAFPPLKLMADLLPKRETPARTPWWLLALRMLIAALVILAVAGPVLNPQASQDGPSREPLVLLVDNGAASARDWAGRVQLAESLIAGAGRDGRAVALAGLAEPAASMALGTPAEAEDRLRALALRPHMPDRAAHLADLQSLLTVAPGSDVAWISDGVRLEADDAFARRLVELARNGRVTVHAASAPTMLFLADVENLASSLNVRVIRAEPGAPSTVNLRASDQRGIVLGETSVLLAASATDATASFALPIEVRNAVTRIEIVGERSAGAVLLVDDSAKRRRVGLVTGVTADVAQPLLSPTYYLSRALGPFADIREPRPGSSDPIGQLLDQNLSVLMLADVGGIDRETTARITAFMERGGVLVRFAGPRLASASDDLTPVRLRRGGRSLGGALSWDAPKTLAPFNREGPFAELSTREEVTVTRQILAEPDGDLSRKVWASLVDGTPIVTAERRGAGLVVLFHVTADTTWSSLPLSGLFVDMLRRIVALSGAAAADVGQTGEARVETVSPVTVLDGQGGFRSPPATARPVPRTYADRAVHAHPPGFYGPRNATLAINTLKAGDRPAPIDFAASGIATRAIEAPQARDLRPPLLVLALLLLAADTLATLWLGGRLKAMTRARAAAASLLLAVLASGAAGLHAGPAQAQQVQAQQVQATPPAAASATVLPVPREQVAAAATTRLAFVLTGDRRVDDTSKAGLEGLTLALSTRTALEPGEPVGVDPSRDELGLFPILYWPIVAGRPLPGAETMRRLDAFMKGGGFVIFDTRDADAQRTGRATPEGDHLKQMLSIVDVPELEPVPRDHVLTKTFYLIDGFPGRYDRGQTWVEVLPPPGPDGRGPARAADGVSPIVITSNDLAAAWATDRRGGPLFPLQGSSPRQREMSLRGGINLVMYALTGNYKADQVHVPALLERLGQ
ncbi:MAG: DUF4159 domain-containing protein [Beijerinckiaceae bacterium]|nr:DUF4159 domain-containing protein [Beijerinckiaceae bacterium]